MSQTMYDCLPASLTDISGGLPASDAIQLLDTQESMEGRVI